MKVWLDDVRDPVFHGYVGWVWIKTYEDCIVYLETFWHDITEISLDHDLGILSTLGIPNVIEKTGYDVAKWIEEKVIVHGWRLPVVRVHSANSVGRKNMEAALTNATRFYVAMNVERGVERP